MSTLEELHKKEIEITKAIHNACEKMGIHYSLIFGSLLGAVRHKGFIPWDDDMDICMLRPDYDRFIAEGNQYLPAHIQIQHCLTEEECPNIFAKVRNLNTTFLAAEHVNLNINHGIFIDVFPVDSISSDPKIYLHEARHRRQFQTVLNCYDIAYVNTIHRKSSRMIAHLIRGLIIRGILRKKTRKQLILEEDHRRAMLQSDEKKMSFLSLDPLVVTETDKLQDLVLYDFEGEKFWGPRDYDGILKNLYGNYMKVPPKEQQITHKPLKIDLENGYKI